MAETPNSIVTPQHVKTAYAVCTAAKSDYTSTTNAVRLLPLATVPNGALVKKVTAIPRGSNPTSNKLHLYGSPDGTTMYLTDSALLPAYSDSTGTATTKADFGYTNDAPLRVQAGEELWVATSVAVTGGVVFRVEYEAF